jgi:putative ABC transport system substrate-binding protein
VFKNSPLFKVWQDSLRDHGWIEGKNLIIDYRSAEGHAERIPPLAAELVALKPDLLVGPSPQVALALKSATATIPTVFVAVYDPVAIGLVQSLSRPGGNVTGLATYAPGDWIAKRIEILRELVPGVSKIALLVNPDNPVQRLTLAEEVPRTARSFGVALPIVEATTADELDTAFASAVAQQADAMIVFADPLTTIQHAPRVVALAAEHHLPAIYLFRQFADGGLIVYGAGADDADDRGHGEESSPRWVDGREHHGVVYCRRVCGWRAKHAVSLGHGKSSSVFGVRAGAEVRSFPSACFYAKQKL